MENGCQFRLDYQVAELYGKIPALQIRVPGINNWLLLLIFPGLFPLPVSAQSRWSDNEEWGVCLNHSPEQGRNNAEREK